MRRPGPLSAPAAAVAVVVGGVWAWLPAAGGVLNGPSGFALKAAPSQTVARQAVIPRRVSQGGRPVARPVPVARTGTARELAPGPAGGLVATLSTAITYSATPGGPPAGTLAATNPFGAANVLAVVGPERPDGWVEVELPVRPNGSTAYILASSVSLGWSPYAVTISLGARTMTVWHNGAVALRATVGIGSASTPTPTGSTYVWELVRPDDQSGPYGPYILGLAMFSNAIAVFNGGDAQIAIHGTNLPWTVGAAASHGCLHVPNALVTQLAGTIPLGTPVTISA